MAWKVRHASADGREAVLAGLVERQYGVVSERQLRGIGCGRRTVARWSSCGRLHLVHRGVYAVGRRELPLKGHWIAAVLACGDGAVLSHASAAAHWGLIGAKPRVDVTAPCGNQGVLRLPLIQLHRCRFGPLDTEVRDRIPVTTVARTLFDLAEAVSFSQLSGAWEEADRLHLLRLREVEAVCKRGRGRRSLKPIRRLLAEARATTTTRSPLEDRFQRFCRFYGLPPHSTNVGVLGKEVDVLWPAARLIVELDSWEFHRHRAAFQGDRKRDTRLLVAGYRTARVTHERLDSEADTLATEIQALLGVAPGSAG